MPKSKGDLHDWLEEQEFYELMHTYRHAQEWTQPTVVEAFEAVKRYIREHALALL